MNHRQDADATAKAKMRSNAQRPTPNIELKNEGARNSPGEAALPGSTM
jgi:hypothetical protein